MPEIGDPLKTGQDIRDRAFAFACQIVLFSNKLYQGGGVGRVMAPQLLRCGTAVVAMLDEAKAAESRRDFISKCSIALKECREVHVRLRMHETAGVGPIQEATALRTEAHEIMSIVAAIIRNTRRNSAAASSRRS